MSKDGQAIGIGAGQQSRVHCTRLAGQKADNWFLRQSSAGAEPAVYGRHQAVQTAITPLTFTSVTSTWMFWLTAHGRRPLQEKPAVFTKEEKRAWLDQMTDVALGSDAFFPFGDNIERAHKSGVKYIAQPGGSVRDDSVIETCNKYGHGNGLHRHPSVPPLRIKNRSEI